MRLMIVTVSRALASALIGMLLTACGSAAGRAAPTMRSTSARPVSDADGEVIVHVPKRHGSIGVVVLHSYEHGPSELVVQGWNATADKHGFIAIYPTRGPDWNAGLCCGAASSTHRDDVGWLTAQIHALAAKYVLSAVYLAGNSNGAMMVERLVSEAPKLSSRFAVWAGAPEFPSISDWRGQGFLYDGALDTTVPRSCGNVRIAGKEIRIKAAVHTSTCLPAAHLHYVTFPGQGHSPPSDWPEIAWQALQSLSPSRASLQPLVETPRCVWHVDRFPPRPAASTARTIRTSSMRRERGLTALEGSEFGPR